jgi:hypothetical protein
MLLAAVGSVRAQGTSTSKSISIQIVAYVPPTLRLDLDFSRNGSLAINGRIRGEKDSGSLGAQSLSVNGSGQSNFDISPGATIIIGNASLFSNLPGTYSVIVRSSNGGYLRHSNSAAASPIPYQLMLGDRFSSAQQGSFRFAFGGKAGKRSPDFKVALSFGTLDAEEGGYSDNLSFSIVAG